MKININNIEGNTTGANVMINLIIQELLEGLEDSDGKAEDIRLEEVSVTYTVKPEGEEDYFVLSTEHDEVKELLEIDYNLRAGVREDNIKVSNYSDEDKLQVLEDLGRQFETVVPKLNETELTFTDQEIIGDMVVRNFDLLGGRKATRVFQTDKRTKELRLIQEFSYKEDEGMVDTADDIEEEVN